MLKRFLLLGSVITICFLASREALCAPIKKAPSKLVLQNDSACSESSPDYNPEACELEEQELKTTQTDSQLNKIYKKLTSNLNAEQKKDLVAAQRLWIQFHKKDCDFMDTLMEGGSPIRHSIVFSGCREDYINTRIKQLTVFCSDFGLKCE